MPPRGIKSTPETAPVGTRGGGWDTRLGQRLCKFFSEQMGVSGRSEIHVLGDLIVLRFKDALSSGELEIGTVKSGRLLVKELIEKACRQVQPELDRLLQQITHLQLLGVDVAIFWKRSEKIFLMTMSDKVRLG